MYTSLQELLVSADDTATNDSESTRKTWLALAALIIVAGAATVIMLIAFDQVVSPVIAQLFSAIAHSGTSPSLR